MKTLLRLATAALAFVALPSAATESYDGCTGTIASLPATLTTQGVWCLKSDLATTITSGAAITVAANNVTIDCNGFKVGGLAAGPGTMTIGIDIFSRLNSVVRHCHLRGFHHGIETGFGGGHVIEDNRVVASTARGIYVGSPDSVVRRNFVADTGGTPSGTQDATAIFVSSGVDVLDNTIVGVAPLGTGTPVGIFSAENPDATIGGNRVRGLVPAEGGGGVGIFVSGPYRAVVQDNVVFGSPVAGDHGILCSTDDISSIRNAINGFTTSTLNCLSSGDVVNP